MIGFTVHDKVAVVDIDDGKANAIDHAFCEALTGALDRAEKEARAVALFGRPDRFCAGFNLKEFQKGPEATEALLRAGSGMLTRLFAHPQPLVIGGTGHAVAGGALILLTGDVRVQAAGDYKIGLNETAIDMVLPAFGLILAEYRLGPRYVEASFVQAQLRDPDGACAAGFVDRVVPKDDLRNEVISTAAALAELPPAAYAGNKANLRGPAIARLKAAHDAPMIQTA